MPRYASVQALFDGLHADGRTIELTTRFKRDYRRESKGQHGVTLDASLRPVDALANDRSTTPTKRDMENRVRAAERVTK